MPPKRPAGVDWVSPGLMTCGLNGACMGVEDSSKYRSICKGYPYDLYADI